MKFSRLTFEKTTERETTMTNTIQIQSAQDITNTANVSYYVDKIKNEMTVATGAWRNVAELFAAASNEFGNDSDKFKALVKATNFSRSKVAKLIAIANDQRLKTHEEIVQCVDAWTVMYEMTTLTNDEFQEFISSVKGETVITKKEVNAARVKETVKVDPYKTVFSIQIDVNAIQALLFSGTDYQELIDAIETIQNTMNYVRVQQTNLFENDAACFAAELDREYNKQVRKIWNDEKKKFIARSKCQKTIAELKEDIQATFNEGDYKEAFSRIDSDAFDQNELMNISTRIVYEKREKKFGLKASDAALFANTAILVAA